MAREGCNMTEFVIRPHGRLHDRIADEKGYFRDEGLSYRIVGDEARENHAKQVDVATGQLREIRSGAYEMYEQGGGSKGDVPPDISCACHWTVNEAAARNVGRMWANAYSVMPGAVMVRADSPIRRPEDPASAWCSCRTRVRRSSRRNAGSTSEICSTKLRSATTTPRSS
jgi:NitT/TauT family transport system substrate-binding protein